MTGSDRQAGRTADRDLPASAQTVARVKPGPTVLTFSVLVGGLSKRPLVIGGQVEVREVLDLTVTFDHNVVDGAPTDRFVADLRQLIKTAEVLR